jgi:hypothetical protein
VQFFTGISIALFFFFGADYLAIHYFQSKEAIEVLKIFAFFFVIINVFQIITNFFMAIQNTFYTKAMELMRMFFSLLSVLFLFFFDYGTLINFSYCWLF